VERTRNRKKIMSAWNRPVLLQRVRVAHGGPHASRDAPRQGLMGTRLEGHAAEAQQQLDGKAFQRWSRHRTGTSPWKIGRDNLGTHIILVEDWLTREFEKCPLP
jgi:hypothetical protein